MRAMIFMLTLLAAQEGGSNLTAQDLRDAGPPSFLSLSVLLLLVVACALLMRILILWRQR